MPPTIRRIEKTRLEKIENNVRLYPWFRMAADCHAWIPVFFLYMSSVLPLDRVIQLSAIYYVSVFVLEVPSGYFSDRIGRRTTLLLAALCLVAAHSCFLVADGFWSFAAGQILLAAGIAMQSGTDTALHYDSLKLLGREREYAAREAKAEQWGLSMLAIATLSGGALGIIDLRFAYAFSLLGAIAMGVLVWRFTEPAHSPAQTYWAPGFFRALHSCVGRLRDPVLGWIFLTMIVLYAMSHSVFEFYQPYISLLDIRFFDTTTYVSLISGVVIAVSMIGGALGAKVSVEWQAKLGLIGLLAVALVIQLGIVAGMALLVHSSVLVLIFTRNFPMSLVHAPVNAAIAPRIDSRQRATYLSMQSLSERLVFALLLYLLSMSVEPGEPVSEATLGAILTQTLYIGIAASVVLFLIGRQISRLVKKTCECYE
jgi:MFS family permease